MAELFKIYDKDGKEHQMTWANAQDMKRNAGWSMAPGVIVHGVPDGVEPAKTPKARDEQNTVVEIPGEVSLYVGVDKEVLQVVAEKLDIDVDKRWAEKRLITLIEIKLDENLTESGDTEGLPNPAVKDADAEKARLLRAWALAAKTFEVEWTEAQPLKDLVEAIAAA